MTNRQGIVAALLATTAFAGPAFAQTANPESTEEAPVAAGAPGAFAQDAPQEIVVTGIRGSQEKSVELKREAVAIVDAISAEDIGKLPDVTIVDALQRISGVQIQRSAGEGATVNIRGLPQVVTLLNGEQYLSPGNLGSAQPNLNDIPAQLMNAVVVYKSTDLRNALSGISGTIDLRTRRPFDLKDGLTLSGTGEYARGRDTKHDDYLFSGLASWRSGNFGLLASAAYSKANLGNNYSGISGGPFGNNDWGGSADNWIAPHGYDTFHREVERNRLGISGAMQWEMDPGITLTAEVFYTKLEEHNRAAGMNISNRWNGVTWTTPTDFEKTSVVGSNGNPWLDVDQYDLDAWWVNSFSVNRTTDSHTTDINVELDFDRGGPFSFTFRGIHADADYLSVNGQVQADLSNWHYGPDRRFTLFRDPADRTRGTFYPADIAAMYPPSRYTNDIVGSNGGRYVDPNPYGYGEDPQLHIDISGRNIVWSGFDNPISGGLGPGHSLADYMANKASYTIAAYSSEGDQHNSSQLTAFRWDGAYDFEKSGEALGGFLKRIDLGARASKRRTQIVSYHLFSNFYAGNGAQDPNGCAAQWKAIDVVMNNPQCMAGEMVPNPAFDPTQPVSASNPETVFQGYTVNRPTAIDEHNPVYFLDDFGSVTEGFPGVWVVDPRAFDEELEFQKRVFGNAFPVIVPGNTYDVNFYEKSAYANAAIEAGNLSGNIGVKAVRTRISVRQNLTGPTVAYGDTNTDIGDYFDGNSYWDILPAVNLQYQFNYNLKLRAAFSKTMIPLDLGNYGGGLSISTVDAPCGADAGPTDAPCGVRQVSGAGAGGNPHLDPWRSNNYDVALEYYFGRASLLNIGYFRLDIDSFVTTETRNDGRFPDGDGVIRRTVPFTRPVQGRGGSLQGIEAGAKLAFSDVLGSGGFLSNFGIDANYTYSDSSQQREDLSGKKLPFQDNSKHQVNAALWYQDSHLQARVAYNYRTPRLASIFTPAGESTQGIPIYQDDSQYVDLNVTYNFNDHFAIYANASNVFGEIERYYFQFDADHKQYHSRNEFEPRYSAGVRFKF